MRSKRAVDQLRPISFTRNYTCYAEGSVLVCFGNTKVICNASVEARVPRFLMDKGQGWVTAEYSMLPRSTHDRMRREAAVGKQSGRSLEIQRLIGRSLRAAVDLKALGEHTISIDCDVIQADGGTRTAAISGACVALVDALRYLQRNKMIVTDPLKTMVAAISVGVHNQIPMLDLDYQEDSKCDTDMNVVMTSAHEFIEIQGTAEGKPLRKDQLNELLQLAEHGIDEIIAQQVQCLADS